MAKLKFPKPKTASHIPGHSYNPDTKTLTVHFKSGRSYEYSNVSPDTATGFKNADSKGKFLNAKIIGKHDHKEITPTR